MSRAGFFLGQDGAVDGWRGAGPKVNAAIPLRWVRLAKWCEWTGDTSDGVHTRRQRGEWVDGVQCRTGPDWKAWR